MIDAIGLWRSLLAKSVILLIVALPIHGHSKRDSFSIYFETGVFSLNPAHKNYLDSLTYTSDLASNGVIQITGYADEPGHSALNDRIATHRALSVRSYLLSSGIPPSQIEQCNGLGNVIRTGNDIRQRRVDIVSRKASAAITARPQHQDSSGSMSALGNMRPDEVFVLEGILFSVSTAFFRPESIRVLNQLVDVLKKFPLLKISIEGHICCGNALERTINGKDAFYSLSVDRAQAVCTYLVKHGIDSNRLSFKGLGFTRPRVFPERNPKDQFRNRRVEIRVVANG